MLWDSYNNYLILIMLNLQTKFVLEWMHPKKLYVTTNIALTLKQNMLKTSLKTTNHSKFRKTPNQKHKNHRL
ncbi:hypothetical protein CDV25_09640 [Helicobacter apodemus]|uniref:Uncharacterized protein n=1 Tax=Helicobacter apodemus TaxID=135569 RepID=A0A2U8FFG9_9HELI|nr:hypothetical protein CDV25_09640 [Helicobacter apodemus]